jgi:hypothetical protein
MIDLMAISSLERDTEVSYVRRERDWLSRAQASGRDVPAGRLLPMLPPGAAAAAPTNGHAAGGGSSHAHAK